jgi:hypothetical protein
MKKRAVSYWIVTGLVALAFVGGGAMDVLAAPEMVASVTHLGYPAYLGRILGVWKLLGALTVLAPGLPRLKEWAYAGMFFNLTGAAVSHVVVGDGIDKILPPLLLSVLVLASWALRPAGRKLA